MIYIEDIKEKLRHFDNFVDDCCSVHLGPIKHRIMNLNHKHTEQSQSGEISEFVDILVAHCISQDSGSGDSFDY